MLRARFAPLSEYHWQWRIWQLMDLIRKEHPDLPKARPVFSKQLRRTDHRTLVLDNLKDFRQSYWTKHYTYCSQLKVALCVGPNSALPDTTAAFLATNSHIRTDDLKTHVPG